MIRKLSPFIIAIIATLVIMADSRLPGHYAFTHYDARDLALQIIWGVVVGAICWGIAELL